MKLSEIPYGTKILVPCVRCGDKRSMKFGGPAQYRKQLESACRTCTSGDRADSQSLASTKNWSRQNTPREDPYNSEAA